MIRPLRLLALTCVLLCTGAVWGEVRVTPACRVKNRPPGRCGWCALETLARHHHVEMLYGLTDKHASRCSTRGLEKALNRAGIPYRIQYPGERDKAILRYAINENLGAVVGFREAVPGGGGHIVTLID